MSILLGLAGFKRSGKDSVADHLVEQHGFIKYALASPIKEALKTIFLWDDDDIELRKEVVDPEWGISPRQAMQHMGTEWAQYDLGRNYSEYGDTTGRRLWVKRLQKWYREEGFPSDVVVSDVRFPHEVQGIRDLGGSIILVERPYMTNYDTHESERHIESLDVDYRVSNNSTLERLHREVEHMVVELRRRSTFRMESAVRR